MTPAAPAPNATTAKILDGAMRALARRGLRKLSMSDVCDEAGVSRGTLYRYFKSKEAILEAIACHVQESFVRDLALAIEGSPDPDDRIRLVVDVLMNYGDRHPESQKVLEVEPGFALDFLSREFPRFLRAVQDALAPVVSNRPDLVAEMVLRIGIHGFLSPGANGEKLPQRVARLFTEGTTPAAAAR